VLSLQLLLEPLPVRADQAERFDDRDLEVFLESLVVFGYFLGKHVVDVGFEVEFTAAGRFHEVLQE
jgi:hypothetical protein